MPDGIIVIDKPQGWTSMDVCAKLRRLLGEKRIGHAGTLDPMATGVLPVFVGRATRAVEFAEKGSKEYVARLRLGEVTDTQDVTGTILERHPVTVTKEDLESVLSQFTGDIMQIPPMYSALKKDGKKLYELARKGKTVEREARPITIYELELTEQFSETDFGLRFRCSKGTYIRTLCHDIGNVLGCGGTMAALRRTEASGFVLEQSVTMDRVIAAAEEGTVGGLLMPIDSYFREYDRLDIRGECERRCLNGNSFRLNGENGLFRVYGEDGSFLMLGRREDGIVYTVKSFFAPKK